MSPLGYGLIAAGAGCVIRQPVAKLAFLEPALTPRTSVLI